MRPRQRSLKEEHIAEANVGSHDDSTVAPIDYDPGLLAVLLLAVGQLTASTSSL